MSRQSDCARAIIIGAAIAVAIALAATAWPVFSPKVLEHYSDSPDSVGITQWAERATTDDMLRWWSGTWIQADSYYYRPLSSHLFYAQYRLFGWNFQGHVIISWLIHAIICYFVYVLALRIYPGRCRPVVAAGVLAVLLVNLRLGPTGPHWPAAPVAYSVVAWWPAQTDQMSLLMSLIALLALDRWLLGEDPRGLLKAGLLWVAAVLFKEMAVVLPLLAGVLMLMRRGRGILRLREADDEGIRRFSPGIAWRFIFPALVAVALFLFARAQIVPEAWGIEPRGEASLAMKAVFLLFSRPWMVLVAHGAWVAVAAAVNATLITIYIYNRKRPSVVWLILALIIVNGLIAEVLGGNFALLTVPIPLGALGTLTLLALGLIALAHVREGWLWGLLGMALLVHLPLINVSGPHYFYWPAAFWGLFNAGLWLWTLPRIRGDARNRPQTGLSGNVTPELDSSSGEGL